MKHPAVLLLMAALGACAVGPDRRALLTPLIGATEADLVQRMGVPNRTIETGGIKFLAYTERHVDVIPGMAPFPAWSPWYYGYYGGYGGFPPEVIERNCETTFELVGGRVRSFSLRGNDCA
jgi:hypothetical protein